MLPPIRTSGSIGDTYRTSQVGDAPRENVNQVTGRLRAATYIWQPWFVTTEGGVSFTEERQESAGSTGDDQIIGGDAKVGVLPLSPFPTAFSYSRTDSRIDGDVGTQYTAERASVVQQIVMGSDLRMMTILSRDLIDQQDSGEEQIDSANFVLRKSFGRNQFSLNLRRQDSDFVASVPEETDERRVTDDATLLHSYVPTPGFRLSNTASYIRDENDIAGQLSERVTTQGISTQQWRSMERPFTINSALRASREDLELSGLSDEPGETRTDQVSGAVGMNYRFGERLTANAGLNASTQRILRNPDPPIVISEPLDEREHEASILGGLNYGSDAKQLGKFAWRWFAGTNAKGLYRETRADDVRTEHYDASGGGNLGHSATRPVPVLFLGPGSLGFAQSGGVALTTDDPEDDKVVPNISHDLSLTYSGARRGTTTYMRFSVNDRREFVAEDAKESQLVLFQLNRRSQVDSRRNWNAALTAQASRQRIRGDEADLSVTATGRIGYVDSRFFDINGLRFISDLELNALGLEDVIENDRDQNRFEEERRAEWSNKIEYRIGKIMTSVEGNIFYVGDEYGNSVFFRIRRDFDGVF